MTLETWQSTDGELPARDMWQALKRGMMCKCPACGQGALFKGYLKPKMACDVCGEDLSHQQADDAPPYFTIFAVGHLVVPTLLYVEIEYQPPLWFEMSFWLSVTLVLSLAFLRPIKGAVIGWQWAMYMHGFDPRPSSHPGPQVLPGGGG